MFKILENLIKLMMFVGPYIILLAEIGFIIAGCVYLCMIKKGRSYLEYASICFTIAGLLACYEIGAASARDISADEWFWGCLWVMACSLLVAMAKAFKTPSVVIAMVLWGFILGGMGDIHVDDPETDDFMMYDYEESNDEETPNSSDEEY